MSFDVDITEHVHIVMHVPEDVHYADHQIIKDILLKDFEYRSHVNYYDLKSNDDKSKDNSDSVKVRLLWLHSNLKKANIPHRLAVVADPYSIDKTIKFSYFFWFNSEGAKKYFKYTPYIPTERDFLSDEYIRKLHTAGNHTMNYAHALDEYDSYSSDSPETSSRPSQTDLRHLYLSKQFLST